MMILSELVKIRILSIMKKHKNAIISILMIVITVTQAVAVFCICKTNEFEPKQTVIGGWNTGWGRYYNISAENITKEITVYATFPNSSEKNDKILICSKGLNIRLSKKGKEIADFKGSMEESYCFFNSDDFNSDDEIILHLEPINGIGKILSPVYLTTKNEYIVCKTKENFLNVILFCLLFTATVILAILVIMNIKSNKSKARIFFHLALCILQITVITAIKTEIPLIIFDRPDCIYNIILSSTVFLSIETGNVYLSISKHRKNAIAYSQGLLTIFWVLIEILTALKPNFEKYIALSNIFLLTMLLQVLCFRLENTYLKSVQKKHIKTKKSTETKS